MLVPGLNYAFETYVECQSDKGISDNVKVSKFSMLKLHSYLLCMVYKTCFIYFAIFIRWWVHLICVQKLCNS